MKEFIFILIFLIGFPYSSFLSAQDDITFDHIVDLIYDRLDNHNEHLNLDYIDSLTTTSFYNSLNCFQKGKIYHLLGVTHYVLNQEKEAISAFEEFALAKWEDCDDVPDTEKANTIFNIGIAYQYTDEPHHSKSYIERALSIFEKDPDYNPLFLAQNYLGAGNYYIEIHDIEKAEAYFLNALNIYKQLPDTELDIFDIYNLLIILNLDFENFKEAKNYFTKAISYYQKKSSIIPADVLSQVYMNGAEVLRALREYEEAAYTVHKAMSHINKTNHPVLYAIGLEILGTIDKEKGADERALKYFHEILKIRRDNEEGVHSNRSISIAYENIGELLLTQDNFLQAEQYIDSATLALSGTLDFDSDNNPIVATSIFANDIDVLRILSLKSEAYQRNFERGRDTAHLLMSLNLHYKIDSIIGRNITTYQSEHSKLQIYDLIGVYYSKGIEIALHLSEIVGDPRYIRDAHYFSSKSKALILRSQISDIKAFEAVASPELIKEEKRLKKRLNEIKESIFNLSEAPDTLMREYLKAQVQLDAFIQDISTQNPEYYHIKHAFKNQHKVSDIQDFITEKQVVLEYFFSEEKLYSFWISKNDFFCLTINDSPKINNQIESYLNQVRSVNNPISSTLSFDLYDQLIGQGLDKLSEQHNELFILPDAVLHSLPFEALISSKGKDMHYLIEDFTIAMSYSSHQLFSGEAEINGKKSYVGFGTSYDSDLTNDLHKLSYIDKEIALSGFNLSVSEVQKGADIFTGRTYINNDASTSNFKISSQDADIIHLSLHGLVNIDFPSKSCIVFDNSSDDFVLTASDLYSHRMNANLVVLSSCHSASGKIYRGEGVQGMTKAFLLAGANNIVSSLWGASERTSSDILTSFLQLYKDGHSMSKSLRKAKLDYLSHAIPSQRHPYYWANYVLIGDVTSSIQPNGFSPYSTSFLLVILLAIFLCYFMIKRS